MFNGKYGYRKPSEFNKQFNDIGIQLGVVKVVGTVPVNADNEIKRKSDERFNADPTIIRCIIPGSNWDKELTDSELTNCFPLMPSHLNVIPKVGEGVFIFTFNDGTKYGDRFYMGPIISTPLNLKKDDVSKSALAGLSVSPVTPSVNIDTLPETKGVFPNIIDIALQGRDNADLILKENELFLRAGQHNLNNNLVFNKNNPAYIQLKFNAKLKESENKGSKAEFGSVVNVVANKINLLTHKDGSPRFTITDQDGYISEKELLKILDEAHPLVFGDTLLEYLKKLELALANHVHRFPGLKWSAIDGENFIKEYLEYPTDTILSKNVKTN
jgi:hypothetical protein